MLVRTWPTQVAIKGLHGLGIRAPYVASGYSAEVVITHTAHPRCWGWKVTGKPWGQWEPWNASI